jgi:signal transduction histidine kinase
LDQPLSKHLFLLHRNEVVTFRENLGPAEAVILLKPVNRATLSAFLSLAASGDHLSTERSLRTDRDEMLQCLIASNLKLQQYEQDRTNFLTRAIHDFRAPLTAVGGYCGLLYSGALGPISDEQKEVLRRTQHSIKRLSRMASAMFELGVGRQVKRKPDLRPGDLREVVERAVDELTPLAEAKGLSVSVDLAPQPGPIRLEAGQMEQVLINLLDNAYKFTPRDGVIEIRGYPTFWERRSERQGFSLSVDRRKVHSRVQNAYRVDLVDSGPPIPEEYIATLFEEYTSYSGGDDRSGAGLGLAICKMIVGAHEGKIWMENSEFGPRFSFLLPVYFSAPGDRNGEFQFLSEEIN